MALSARNVHAWQMDGYQFLSLKAIADLMQIDALILERSPEPLDEDVIHTSTLAIHADFDARIKQHLRKLVAGELTALVRIKYLRRAIELYGLFECLDTKICRHRVA